MSKWADDPEKAVGLLLDDVIEAWGQPDGDQLAVDLPPYVLRRPEMTGAVSWSRRVERSLIRSIPKPWPPEAPRGSGYVRAIVRMPRAKAEVDMTLSAVLARMAVGGEVWLVGGNDEGIKSGFLRLQECAGVDGDILAQRAHGRVVRVVAAGPPVRDALAHWRTVGMLDLGMGARPWVSYPGVFNKGMLDDGTALLLKSVPLPAPGTRVLDFASGPGAIAAYLLAREPKLALTLLDNDTVALEAARENVKDAEDFVVGGGIKALGARKFALIVSNPPIHDGFREDFGVLHSLVEDAPRVLDTSGTLILVVQRRIALDRTLLTSFDRVETLADDGRYRVFAAHGPKPLRTR